MLRIFRRIMWAQLVLLPVGAGLLLAGPVEDSIVRQLRQQGFTEIEVRQTWLGRSRITAESPKLEREIIVNPATGEILRDFWESKDDNDERQRPSIFNPNRSDDRDDDRESSGGGWNSGGGDDGDDGGDGGGDDGGGDSDGGDGDGGDGGDGDGGGGDGGDGGDGDGGDGDGGDGDGGDGDGGDD